MEDLLREAGFAQFTWTPTAVDRSFMAARKPR